MDRIPANVSQVNELFCTFPDSFFLLYNSCEEMIIMTEPFLIFQIRFIYSICEEPNEVILPFK